MTALPKTTLRWATAADYNVLGAVMFDAIRFGPSLYSNAHRLAWAPQPNRGAKWHARLAPQQVILAEDAAGDPDDALGFLSLKLNRDHIAGDSGYIDLAFIRAKAQRRGLFRALYAEIEGFARQSGAQYLTTHASLMAQPAFAAMGFDLVRQDQVMIGALAFQRAEMSKRL